MAREFEQMNEVVEKLRNLGISDLKKPFILRTGASNVRYGSVLLQENNGVRKPIE